MSTVVEKTQSGFAGGWESAGRLASRFFSTLLPDFYLQGTVRQLWREVAVTPFGLPTLDRFPQFSAMIQKRTSIGIQVMPKTAEIDQPWPFLLLPSSAVALLHYLQPSKKHT